jgi:hypothetical protein
LRFLRLDVAKKKKVPSTVLKKPHTFRCACSHSLQRTEAYASARRTVVRLASKAFEQPAIKLWPTARDFYWVG